MKTLMTTDRQIIEAKKLVEHRIGFDIPEDVADQILDYSRRKCAFTKQPGDYLPLLYENELMDYYVRRAVNALR